MDVRGCIIVMLHNNYMRYVYCHQHVPVHNTLRRPNVMALNFDAYEPEVLQSTPFVDVLQTVHEGGLRLGSFVSQSPSCVLIWCSDQSSMHTYFCISHLHLKLSLLPECFRSVEHAWNSLPPPPHTHTLHTICKQYI